MSIFNLILSIYLLLLSGLPCSDNFDGQCKDNLNCVENRHHDVNDAEQAGDQCSPLCTCACCGLAFTPFFYHHFKSLERSFEVVSYVNLTTPKLIFASLSIWQPPKLSQS